MRRLLPPLLALLVCLAAPPVLAQNDTTPPPEPGSEAPGPESSLEGQPGNVYGIAILVGTVAIGGLLAYVTRRQKPRQ